MEVGLGSGNFVLDEDPVPTKKGHSPQFLAHVYCGQTARWIKMLLGRGVGLGPGEIVFDEGQPLPRKGHAPESSAHVYFGQTVAHLICCWAHVNLCRRNQAVYFVETCTIYAK